MELINDYLAKHPSEKQNIFALIFQLGEVEVFEIIKTALAENKKIILEDASKGVNDGLGYKFE